MNNFSCILHRRRKITTRTLYLIFLTLRTVSLNKVFENNPPNCVFPFQMATLRNRRKVAALKRISQKNYHRERTSRDKTKSRLNLDYITRVLEQIEGSVATRISRDFNRTESRIFAAFPQKDEFFLHCETPIQSKYVSGTFGYATVETKY